MIRSIEAARAATVAGHAEAAGMIPLTIKRQFAPDTTAVDVIVWIDAARVVTLEASLTLKGEIGCTIVELDGGTRRYVRESVETVLALLAGMREASRGN